MAESVPGLLWLVVLLVANAFFVGAEFANIPIGGSERLWALLMLELEGWVKRLPGSIYGR